MYTKYFEFLQKLLSTSSQSGDVKGINHLGDLFIQKTKRYSTWEKLAIKNDFSLFLGKFRNNADSPKSDILLSAHLDTVYSAKDIEVVQKGNKLYGSGAYDMKASLVTILEVMDKIKNENLKINFDIVLSPDEEMGPQNISREHLKKIAKNYKYIFVLESSLDKEPKLYKQKRTIVGSRVGAIIFDVIIKGPGGHSGVLNQKAERFSTINLASEIIQFLERNADYEKKTTLNVGKIKGGVAVNVLSPITKLSCESRISKKEEFTRIKNLLDELVQEFNKKPFSVDVVYKGDFPVMTLSNSEKEFFELLQRRVEIKLELTERSGGSEGNYFETGNKDAIILDGFGPVGENQHTKEEFVYLDSIEQSANILLQAILLAHNY